MTASIRILPSAPPSPNATDEDLAGSTYTPDFPYTLVGWAYATSYNFARYPTGRGPACMNRSDWYVHERGIHDVPALGFIPVPPKEALQGQAAIMVGSGAKCQGYFAASYP